MKFKRINIIYIFFTSVIILFSLIIYFLKAKIFLDPDFGWSLRLGEVILKSGIPKTDPFSYTMPSYPYVDYEWLTHVIIFKIYMLFGYSGLALIFTLIATVAIIICLWGTDYKFMPLQILFASAILFAYFGVRTQVITWLFFAVVCRIGLDGKYWKKFKYFLPAIFLFWSNLHGGFILGLVILLFVTIQKRSLINVFLLLSSLLITLVNPYGMRLWKEVWISTTDLPIRLYITEWRPVFFSITSVVLLFLAYALAFLLQSKKKLKNFEILLLLLLLTAAFSSARNLPLFLIFSLILLKKGIRHFMAKVENNKLNLSRFQLLHCFFLALVLIFSFIQIKADYLAVKTSNEFVYYPYLAVKYLAKNPPKGQIYSSYDWGGYLDWKLPQKKVFIDGRMASWHQKTSVSESGYIFGENNLLLSHKLPVKKVFDKYNIDTVLLPREWLSNKNEIVARRTVRNFLTELKKNNYKEIYRDKNSIIFSQKNTLRH